MARRGGMVTGVIGLLGLLALSFWIFRDRLPMLAGRPEVLGIGPEAAEVAQTKLQRLREGADTVHLTDAEFTSLIRYHLPGLAGPLLEPSVDFVDNTFMLNGRIPADQIPSAPEFDRARDFMPDTADVTLQGELRDVAPGQVALRVSAGSFARFPVARPLIVRALRSFGNREQPGLAEDEYLFTLPEGVHSARVEEGALVLAARPR